MFNSPNNPNSRFGAKQDNSSGKLHLYALGEGIKSYQPGTLIANRYLIEEEGVVVDTKPKLPPVTIEEIPSQVTPYLKLFPFRFNIPQIYGLLPEQTRKGKEPIWLLEYGFLATQTFPNQSLWDFFLPIEQVWQGATALRQINWLWQMARLWQPLKNQGLASSLLSPELLRVNGAVFKLRQLNLEPKSSEPSLAELGNLWQSWLPGASPILENFLQQLCSKLTEEILVDPAQLVGVLDRAGLKCGRSQKRNYQIFTSTDAGPSRDRNEDACYPPAEQLVTPQQNHDALAIVCDGIGGHEGGEVASALAIAKMREGVENLSFDPEHWNPYKIVHSLENAIAVANDTVSEVNDSEQRHERQRMGTTLVSACAHYHEMYISHVGDSRIYLITPGGCYQLTIDDDVASREVRLGYSLYRDATQNPSSGSLVQALGMGSSQTLHPTVQRVILDENSVFLLCSDGLSDSDRVEEYWEREILPVLKNGDVAASTKRLIKIANEKNGHDNATVALLYCQVNSTSSESNQTALAFPNNLKYTASPSPKPAPTQGATTQVQSSSPTTLQTSPTVPSTSQERKIRPRRSHLIGLLVLLLVIASGLGAMALYFFNSNFKNRVDQLLTREVEVSPTPAITPSPTPEATTPPALNPSTWQPGTRLQLSEAVILQAREEGSPEQTKAIKEIPSGSIIQINSVSSSSPQWLGVQVCQGPQVASPNPSPSPNTPTPLTQDSGWIETAQLVKVTASSNLSTQEVIGQCQPATITPKEIP
ncbi:MAG: protein phosphatase 2C domain-containing protein [Spirulinaceae cyanobacterium]